MSKLAQLREHRNAKAQEAQALNNKYPADQRMPAAEAEKLDQVLAEIEAIDAEMVQANRAAQLLNADDDLDLDAARHKASRPPSEQSDESKALRAYLTGGISALTPEQHHRMQARVNSDIRAAMRLPSNAMSTTTPSEGGYTTSTEYYRQLEEAMKAYGGMREAANTIRTATGASMNFPTADATSEEGEILGQNAAAASGETAFGNATLEVFKYSSKKIALPFELVQDSFLDIESYILNLLGIRIGRITNRHYTTGTGTGQPFGIVPTAALGKAGTTGQVATITYDDLVDLEHAVDPAYRGMPGVGFMMHDSSLKVLRKLKDSQGRPIFVPGYEQGNPGGAPDRLLNRPIIINQNMPVMAASAKSVLFGDFKKYTIRDVMDLTLFRMTDSAFTLLGQVGFVAFMRSGGNLIDAGGAVKYYQNSAT
ncbi:phage major capsid protein [Methylobacillus flagellatus]|uniref:phage major capsid protein n=1 Tax=Methylobacillus flagellatus TaxID=405 RepID=UPI0010F76DA0|nr:phage major capsid protein [Methylobacillus flagellatus]